MSKILYIIFFLVVFNHANSQKSDYNQRTAKGYFNYALSLIEENKNKEAISVFRFIVNNFPEDELYSKSYYNIGSLYFFVKDYDSSKIVFKSILQSNFKEDQTKDGFIESNYKHEASDYLSKIYYYEGKYDSSLYYLSLSDTAYPFFSFCGNSYTPHYADLIIRYADVYEKLNLIEKAKQVLLRNVFLEDYDQLILKELKRILEKEKNSSKIKEELNHSLKNIYTKKTTVNGKEIIQYFIMFQNTEIEIPYDYFYFDEIDKNNSFEMISDSELYKTIMGLE